MTETPDRSPRPFDAAFRQSLRDLVLWRRDVRRFRRDPVDSALIHSLLELACHAPSVGHCQPWRFVLVESAECREAVRSSFVRANANALETYDGEQRARYARLKLEGLEDAPVHLAVFADEATEAGSGLGRQTMPQTLRYSVVAAIQTLWLAARAEGLGLGWISILEPETLCRVLEVPESWTLIAYLCIGRPVEEHLDPELERYNWQERLSAQRLIFKR
ncbi:5,6-dimethylbenzimidazole synthase [Bradyrhizobium sp. Ash2021]|uniref:5,6-dimethylbenzimidazole synthase n=1 Tax=Bradyrhizobium sp. Ash2021 TaxID=2954771 RepID=UPI00281672C8|nr:5,6-dimethylbenzimidazole synthase [Bradyrhizobium sp. Ash2021]WMT78113.1 5,6-dimethylbenzimidazole synthase [Bradyrhizobium sp. Ash2021]